ncbi:unnamed protein product [Bemisia tabaci]|uniref:DNA polymerase subunit gamma-1 n=1 Tax=Bemisia tabaci TaxID=7038 RepID=A0A9P0A917_BEMTA|nr:unnamed protein product [Bemisia tabaci]
MISSKWTVSKPLEIKRIRFFSSNTAMYVSKEASESTLKPKSVQRAVPKNLLQNNDKSRKQTAPACNRTRSEVGSFSLKISDSKNSDQTLVDKNFRVNELNIQMLSKPLYQQLFGCDPKPEPTVPIQKILSTLNKFGLPSMLHSEQDVDLKLPPLEGKDIAEHFQIIGERQSAPYKLLLEQLIVSIPDTPKEWVLKEGWMRYVAGKEPEPVHHPLEDAFVFDVEVCCKEGEAPTIATAVSNSAWYSWCSTQLIKCSSNLSQGYSTDVLIPLESAPKMKVYELNEALSRPKIVVGHNVNYDRARVKEQYWLKKTGMRFMDTMSMHVSVSGVTSYQKNQLKSGSSQDEEWSKFSSLNSLSQVHKLYCGSELSKDERNLFINGSLTDVKDNFQSLMSYCASDVKATHNVLVKLLPLFFSRFPHPVTLAGMLELGLAYLPINSNWNKYISECNQTFDDLNIESKFLLSRRADEACHLLHNEEYKENLWLWDQDWECKDVKFKKEPKKKKSEEEGSKECGEGKPTRKSKKAKKTDEDADEKEASAPEPALIDQNPSCIEPDDEIYELDGETDFILERRKYLFEKFSPLYKTRDRLPKKLPYLAGYPNWYRNLCPSPDTPDWAPGPRLIGTGMQVAPKLLSLKWKSLPIHHIRGQGWGQLVPHKTEIVVPDENLFPLGKLVKLCSSAADASFCNCAEKTVKVTESKTDIHEKVQNNLVRYVCQKKNKKTEKKNKTKDETATECFCCKDLIGTGCGFIKLPHKNGNHLNVGNPLAKDFITKFSESGLSGEGTEAERIIEISRMLSYWRNNRDRIEGQLAVWLNDKDIPRSMRLPSDELGAIIPQVIVCGTLTRRAVERTWMTASNVMDDRIGSELRSMIQAPPGYHIVGADVDSQELWIASAIGDAYFAKEHGSTPFGWMTLSGQKADASDMHSVTAKAIGISRSHAKVINYARIYGAGQPFAEHLLRQFNPGMTKTEAKAKASKMFSLTKGRRLYPLKTDCLPEFKTREFSKLDALNICRVYNKSMSELFGPPTWSGGSESAMFNCLEKIASQPEPKTPFLGCRLSRALEPKNHVDDRFLPTRINWVVQSGAVDFLHLMLVCMQWLVDSNVRFCISFHDEVRYIVPSEQRYQTALALHVTNLLVRAFCVQKLGMIDLPQSVAFFSSVEVDTVLRKESNQDCITPSNPYGLSKGYSIPLGESLNIHETIQKAGGSVGTFKPSKKNLK